MKNRLQCPAWLFVAVYTDEVVGCVSDPSVDVFRGSPGGSGTVHMTIKRLSVLFIFLGLPIFPPLLPSYIPDLLQTGASRSSSHSGFLDRQMEDTLAIHLAPRSS